MTWTRVDEVAVDPERLRVYAEGWQSWSPTAWTRPGPVAGTVFRPEEPWQHTMRFRPGSPLPLDDAWQGEGLLVVEPGTGEATRTYGTTAASADVLSIRAALQGDRLLVSSTGSVELWSASDPVSALEEFGAGFAEAAGVAALRPAPRVWCSWYRYFEEVTTDDVLENVAALDELELPVDVVQLDDGWSRGLGEWLVPSPGVPDLAPVVDAVRSSGRRAGVWLAPFFVGRDTALARKHPDWLVGDAGHNWGSDMVGLDLTHPGVRDHLATTVAGLREKGFDYFKLDFLYAGAVPGRRHEDVTPVEAYRSGLALLREAAGDAYLLGCGAPILPSVGLVDAMRVSPDTFHEGGEDGSTGLRGRMATVARGWQQGRFWVNDPDCLVARPSYSQREEWAAAVMRFGGLRSCSDRLAELDEHGLELTRALLDDVPAPAPFAREVLTAALEEAP